MRIFSSERIKNGARKLTSKNNKIIKVITLTINPITPVNKIIETYELTINREFILRKCLLRFEKYPWATRELE